MYNQFFSFRQDPFSVTPDPDVFYTNSIYQQALSTLVYGIEAKKGLILVTGEAGTGKTTLLRRLTRTLGATTHVVFISHTHFGFIELLKLIALDLGIQAQNKGRLAMIEELRSHLTAQSEEGRAVCLMIDEAQGLSDEALEGIRVLADLGTEKEKLLQIVLIGQPELEARLDRAEFQGLKQRVALRCRLSLLQDSEIDTYIDFRLRSAGYEGKGLFPPETIERISSYASGSPRLINILCDNALRAAYENSQKETAPEMIDRVAGNLRLEAQVPVKARSKIAPTAERRQKEKFTPVEEYGAVERYRDADFERVQTGVRRNVGQPRPRGSTRFWVGFVLAVALFAGSGMALYSQQSRAYLGDLGVRLKRLGVYGRGVVNETAPDAGTQVESLSGNNGLPATDSDQGSSLPPPARLERPVNRPETVPQRKTPRQSFSESDAARRSLRLLVIQAIRNRAITGVEVSVIDGTAFLDGRVETEAQKFAAERAARNVPGIEYVRNRIVANSL